MSLTKPIKSFTKRLGIKITVPMLIFMLFVPIVITSFNAYGQVSIQQTQDCFAPLTTILDATYAGPVVVDSYWVDQGTSSSTDVTSNPVKKEIGPGEGASVFAVVFNNRNSNFPITSITAFLNLPAGFEATGESKNPQLVQDYQQASRVVNKGGNANGGQQYALANYYGQVPVGGAFTMYFNINVLPTAKVSTFATTVVANYVQVGVVGQQCTSALLDVPFVLPGKVILDASTGTAQIPPQTPSPVSVVIENKGSAPATGVVATITNLGSSKGATGSSTNGGAITLSSTTTQLINLGSNTFNIGTIPAKSKSVITTTLYGSNSAAGSTQQIQLQIDYQNAWGKLSSTNINTGLVITPNPPQTISLSYIGNTTTPVITAGNLDNLNFAVANDSNDTMSNILLTLVPQSTSVSIVGPSTWTIQNMQPGDRQELDTKVFAANSLINTPTSFTLTANYVSKGQSLTNSLTLGTFVVGNIKLQIYGLSTSSTGGTSTLVGNLLNQGSTTALFTTVQLAPSPLLDAIRAARVANFTNNQSQSFTPSGQGFQGGGGQRGGSDQSAAGQGFQGGSGQGFQGGSGQGFQGGSGQGFQGGSGQGFRGGGGQRGGANSAQFIGDLSPDSPIPVSVPIGALSSLKPGPYQVAFKVVYADDLKNFHTVFVNGTVMVTKSPRVNAATTQETIFDQLPLPPEVIIGIIIAVAVGVIAFLIRKKRLAKKKLKRLTQGDTDIVSIFDDVKKKDNES